MPISISVSEWSSLSEPFLQSVQAHAARKAAEPVDWAAWLRLESGRFGGFDLPFSMSPAVQDVLERFCGRWWGGWACFVPYTYAWDLAMGFPPPDYWVDEVRPAGWGESLLIVE